MFPDIRMPYMGIVYSHRVYDIDQVKSGRSYCVTHTSRDVFFMKMTGHRIEKLTFNFLS